MQETRNLLDNITIVLNGPKYAENIGAAARCALNMGITRIIVVSDTRPDREAMLRTATHNAAHIIDAIEYFQDLSEALGPFSGVVGTTARRGRQRVTLQDPKELAERIVPLLSENSVALLFGPEDRGLTNDDLKFCSHITTIPTDAFSSLNLAQAVAILCYELRMGVLTAQQGNKVFFSPKRAASHETEGMYEHLEKALLKIGFLKKKDHTYWMYNIRKFLSRIGLRSREVRIIRGVCKELLRKDSHENHGRTRK
ncbi:MAG: RNA methyltransferase [Desulfobulbaceae bacterium]|nr:RNA methyltransferase [Desulfobulbaceae bacterium]